MQDNGPTFTVTRIPFPGESVEAQLESPVQPPSPTKVTKPAGVETWLAAGEVALHRGDLQVARTMVELALAGDPFNPLAWDIDLRIRLKGGAQLSPMTSVLAQVPEPHYEVNDFMFDFWYGNGGLPIFGYPISPRFFEVTGTGEMVQVQYFERARLEYRPALAGTNDEVQNAPLAREVPVSGLPAVSLPPGLNNEQVMTGTGGRRPIPVPRRIFDFWEVNGGLDVLGKPITRVLEDVNSEGRTVWVQYFEKARLEYDPVLTGTAYEVQIARLGSVVFTSKYAQRGEC